jgi:glycosyltransferase involved in cell wall biosynthesis
MRIAIVTTSWPAYPGDPSGHFVFAEAREFERAGHDLRIVAPCAGGAFGWPGAAVRLRERPLSRALDALRWVGAARARVREWTAGDPGARIVAHWAVPSAWPIALAEHRADLEIVSHGADVRLLTRVPLPLRERWVQAMARRASRWRFVSEALKTELLASLRPDTRSKVESIAVVRAASIALPDVRSQASGLRRELGVKRVAVSVGRLVASKRVERAIDYVAGARDLDLLVIVGDGPERAALERRAQSRAVDARFAGLLGREEALAWIAAADVLLHASRAEGCSTVVREAEALGTPVVYVA